MVFLLAGAATASAVACTHDLDSFKSVGADATGQDTNVDGMLDTPIDSQVDGGKPDLGPDADTFVPDTEVDTGPPPPEPVCTAIGPANTICAETAAGFVLGAANPTVCPPSGCATELPEVKVTTTRFFIDEHEVSVGRFRAWWNSTTRTWPATGQTIFTNSLVSVKWRSMWPTAPSEPPMSAGCTWKGKDDATNDDKPINCVDWFTALVMCIGEGKRLATEAEWELVATAGEDRLYPWSAGRTEADPPPSSIDCFHALGAACPPTTTARDSTIWGRTKWGAWNMAGSLAEWTLDGFTAGTGYPFAAGAVDPVIDPTGTLRVVRGGGHLATPPNMRAAVRAGASATSPDAQIGFRCVKR